MRDDGVPSFVEVNAPGDDELHALLQTIITRLMKLLTRRGVLVQDMGQNYLAEPDADGDEARSLRPLQAAAVTYRIALGPRAGQKMLTLRGAMPREGTAGQALCADIDGYSLHAAVRVDAPDRKRLEQLCRYITRPALSDEQVHLNAARRVELKLKTPWQDGTMHLVISPMGFMHLSIERSACGGQIRRFYACGGSAVPIRHREPRTVDGSSVSRSIERPLSGFRPRERTMAYVCSTL